MRILTLTTAYPVAGCKGGMVSSVNVHLNLSVLYSSSK